MIYLNLTNGIEALQIFPIDNIKFVRVQSTKCEQKDWSFIIEDLDYNFLFDLAAGNEVVVIDFSARKKKPRSIYQGFIWIEYVLNRRWFNKKIVPFVKNHNVQKYFDFQYDRLSSRAKKKLDYVKKFLFAKNILLHTISYSTNLDSNYDAYKKIWEEYIYKQ